MERTGERKGKYPLIGKTKDISGVYVKHRAEVGKGIERGHNITFNIVGNGLLSYIQGFCYGGLCHSALLYCFGYFRVYLFQRYHIYPHLTHNYTLNTCNLFDLRLISVYYVITLIKRNNNS